ncbi:MAG: response regulator [Desulfomonilaceae bacterium]|nr:response regulator [Desulfomonilaceae bacterium]
MTKLEVLQDKTILAVDDEHDVLETVQEMLEDYGNLVLHTAKEFDRARQLLHSHNYDLVILDIMGVRGFDLLEIAAHRGFPVVMLTAHALNPEALKKSIELGARAYLPKERLAALPDFLADILRFSYRSVWRKALDDVIGLFNERFGSNWKKSEQQFWTEFEQTLEVDEPAIISEEKPEK